MTSLLEGAQRPVHAHLPAGDATFEPPEGLAREAIDLSAIVGLRLDEWQEWLLAGSMRQHRNRWEAFEVAVIVPRQNGKGALLEARQLAGLFLLADPLQVHTAHEFKTAFEHFVRISQLIEGNPDLDREVQRIRRGAGEQAIELKSGCRLRFLARSTGSGRGMSGDTVYLDEAFALTSPMMGALLPTLSAVPNPQVWYTSSAPLTTSEVLHAVRRRGRDGNAGRLLFAEWGLDQGVDVDDVANWYRTNPALGIRISEEFVRAELDAMRTMPDEFARERLGVAELLVGDITLVPEWGDLIDPASSIASHHSIALDVAPGRRSASFGGAGRRADGSLHVEAWHTQTGTAWVLDMARKSWELLHLPIRIQTGSPAASFINPLREAGIGVVEVSTAEHAQAVGQFIDAVRAHTLHHRGGLLLSAAVKGAELRTSGDVDLWARRTPKVDITPLVAVTLALGGVPAVDAAPTGGFLSLDDFDNDDDDW